MSTVLVLGATGILGSHLVPRLRSRGHNAISQGRTGNCDIVLDPVDVEALRTTLAQTKADFVINLIAMTNVDQCEVDPASAYRANVAVVSAIVEAMEPVRANSPHLIQISTDQLYDGAGPHAESNTGPINTYAWSKHAGELVSARVGATVLRTNFVTRSLVPGRTTFTDWLVASFRSRAPITLFDDVMFSPLHAPILCDFIALAMDHPVAGVFNVGSVDGISKAAFAKQLASRLELDASNATMGRAENVALKARRPLDMRMNVGRFEAEFTCSLPNCAQTLDAVAQDYLEKDSV